MSIIERLNTISRRSISIKRTLFNDDALKNWSECSHKLIQEHKELDDPLKKKQFAQSIFKEVLELITSDEFLLKHNISVDEIGHLLTSFCTYNKSYYGKLLISMINLFPQSDDKFLDNVVSLLNSILGIDSEIAIYLGDVLLKQLKDKWTKDQGLYYKKSLIHQKYYIKKYNLLFESSVGYSQLVMMVYISYMDCDRFQSVNFYWEQLQTIMGKYSLDPIRSLDIILHISSIYIQDHYQFLVDLLKVSYFWPSVVSNAKSWDGLNFGGNPIASRLIIAHLNQSDFDINYMDMCCILIRNGFISYISIFDNLGPDNDSIEEYLTYFYKDLEDESISGTLNPLALAASLPDEGETGNYEMNNKYPIGVTEGGDKSLKENLEETIFTRGKWQLVERCLAHGLLVPSLYSMKLYPKLVPASAEIIRLTMRLFDVLIDQYYKDNIFDSQGLQKILPRTKLSHNGVPATHYRFMRQHLYCKTESRFCIDVEFEFFDKDYKELLTPASTVEEIFRYSHEILPFITGNHLKNNPSIFSKLCKIGIHDLTISNNNEEKIETWLNFFRKFIFPLSPFFKNNTIISSDVYNLMKFFPLERRYFLYNQMLTKLSQDDIYLRLEFNKAEKEVRSILKSLSIDNISFKATSVGRLISTNPLATLNAVLHQIENYDKVSELIVISAKQFSDYAYDVLQYMILSKLTSGRSVLQGDGINQTMWIQRLSIFISDLAKNCPRMDITNICIFITKMLYKDPNVVLSILRELVTRVGGIQTLNNVNWKHLIMINLGPCLESAGRSFILDFREKNLDRSRSVLNNFLKIGSLSEVIIMLYNLTQTTHSDNLHYKVLSTKCDESNELLWSFIEMLKFGLTEDEFLENIIPFDVLVNQFNISTEWAFHIWRHYFNKKMRMDNTSIKSVEDIISRTNFFCVDFAVISVDLFSIFWRLSLYDIYFEESLYDEYKQSLERKVLIAKTNKEKTSLSLEIQKTMSNCLSHKKTWEKTEHIISENIKNYMKEFTPEFISSFLQSCIIPRVLFSSSDAIFSSMFLVKIFNSAQVMELFEFLIQSFIIPGLLFSCTVLEAKNLGFFFKGLLEYMEELRIQDICTEDIRRKLYYLYELLVEELEAILIESNYMSIRNGIEFLNSISSIFPIVDVHIQYILDTLKDKLISDEREDIKLPSNAILGHLTSRLKNSCKPQNFYKFTENELEEWKIKRAEDQKIADYCRVSQLEQRERENKEKMMNTIETLNTAISVDENFSKYDREKSDLSRRKSTLPSMKIVIEDMRLVVEYLKKNNFSSIERLIKVLKYKEELRQIVETTERVPHLFSGKLRAFLRRYFRSLVVNRSVVFENICYDIDRASDSLIHPKLRRATDPDLYSTDTIKYPNVASNKYAISDKGDSSLGSTKRVDQSGKGATHLTTRRYDGNKGDTFISRSDRGSEKREQNLYANSERRLIKSSSVNGLVNSRNKDFAPKSIKEDIRPPEKVMDNKEKGKSRYNASYENHQRSGSRFEGTRPHHPLDTSQFQRTSKDISSRFQSKFPLAPRSRRNDSNAKSYNTKLDRKTGN